MLIPKKSLGQNFLLDKNLCKKIINSLSIRNKIIIEIGPGTGQLTDEIIKLNPKKLILIEKNNKLFKLLKKKYKKLDYMEILNIDAINLDVNLNCAALNHDFNDCCKPGCIRDCRNVCSPLSYLESDPVCDNGTGEGICPGWPDEPCVDDLGNPEMLSDPENNNRITISIN